MADARALYRALFANVRRALDRGRAPSLAGRRIARSGRCCWPSKKFADEDLIPGGGAESRRRARRRYAGRARLEGLKGTFDRARRGGARAGQGARAAARDGPRGAPGVRRSAALGPARARGPGRRRLGRLLRVVRRRDLRAARGAGPARAARRRRARRDRGDRPRRGPPGAMGGAAGIGDLFSGIKAAARRILNYATYYQMKERAGMIGAGGLNPLPARDPRGRAGSARPPRRPQLRRPPRHRRGDGPRRQRECGTRQPDASPGGLLA